MRLFFFLIREHFAGSSAKRADLKGNNSASVLIAGSIRTPFDHAHMKDLSADDWRLTYGIVSTAQVVFLLVALWYASCRVFHHTVYNVGSCGPGLSDLHIMNV